MCGSKSVTKVFEDGSMLQIFKTQDDNTLTELTIENQERGCWFNLIKPTGEELKLVSDILKVTPDFLRDALDEEERSRIEIEDDNILIITNIPMMEDENRFDTLPLGIIITPDYFVTVCLKENKVLSYFNQDASKVFSTFKRTRLLFQILFRSTKFYLRYLKYINKHTDEIEINLRKTMKNKALFQLLELQKSLVYFTTALKDNGIVMEKLMRLRSNNTLHHIIKLYEEDEDLLEDVIIENKQALEMVEMHSNILASMMDAFASIISNNLNIVMKFLTSMTILLAIPTMIASFWGMNVGVPFEGKLLGFEVVVTIAIIATAIAAFVLLKRDMF